jgi:fatty acid desaturase
VRDRARSQAVHLLSSSPNVGYPVTCMASERGPLVVTDVTAAPQYADGWLSTWCRARIHDSRDEVFLRLTLKAVALMLVAMIVLSGFFRWTLVPVYLALWGWFAPPVILMLHCTMHRPFLRRRRWLARAHPYVMSFFFGIPTGYAAHHMGMHHIEDNMPTDLSSTLRYRRDSFLDFLRYFGRFSFVLVDLTAYLTKKRRSAMARRVLVGDLGHQAFMLCALLVNWRVGLVAFVTPYFLVRVMMLVGNWGQHAFINTARANDGLSNSITCINSAYNKRAFNDGYHIGHHLKANRHWSELPQDLLNNREAYVRAGAIVFEGIDFFMVSLLLWTNQWRALAKRFVRLDGKERSDNDVIAMLKSRVQPVHVEDWSTMQPRNA